MQPPPVVVVVVVVDVRLVLEEADLAVRYLHSGGALSVVLCAVCAANYG
jgi:hypothetical protein